MDFSKKKRWVVNTPPQDDGLTDAIRERFRLSRQCAKLLRGRGCRSEKDAAEFLEKNANESRDPLTMADMPKAVARLEAAFENPDEVIAIYGDYDVDGVTSVSLLYLYLTSRGCRAGYYIPSRSEEGYGVNCSAIDKLKARGVTLMITVDTGITATAEVEYAKSLGIDVIVTDHHECHIDLPDAIAVVNPHRSDCPYPFKEFAGVGVTYKLVCALERSRAEREGRDVFAAERGVLLKYADLVAIGTVADVMPIVDENRTIVTMGLLSIEHVGRLGIRALMDAAGKTKTGAPAAKREINANYIGFAIAPRLNAAGRMGDAALAVELLLSDDEDRAALIADQLCEINRERQVEENKIAEEAFRMIDSGEGYTPGDKVIVLGADTWHQGIIGIVASKVTEKYGLPTILVTFENMPDPAAPSPLDVGKGSGRSVKGLNLVSALVACDGLLTRYGGHELAAGLSVTRGNLDAFRRAINEYAAGQFSEADLTVTLEADAVLDASDVTIEFAREIASALEPCGVGNPTPVFIMNDCTVVSIRAVGGGKHTKLVLAKDGKKFSAMFFGVQANEISTLAANPIDVMFTLGVNTYAGETTVQLYVVDLRNTTEVLRERLDQIRRVEEILAGGKFRASEDYLPERRDFVNLYSIVSEPNMGGCYVKTDTDLLRELQNRLPPRDRINYVKYKLLLAIFRELGIIDIFSDPMVKPEDASEWHIPNDFNSFEKIRHKQKIDLESSALLQQLRSQCIPD